MALSSLFEYWEAEAFRGKSNVILRLYMIYANPSTNALFHLRLLEWCRQKRWLLPICAWLTRKLAYHHGIYVGKSISIGIGLHLPHPNGIIIGDGVSIGKEVTIFQQVTLGGKKLGDANRRAYPVVGDHCVIFAGAKVLGAITIGSGAAIGANSVVICDVESDSVYAGIPARRIR